MRVEQAKAEFHAATHHLVKQSRALKLGQAEAALSAAMQREFGLAASPSIVQPRPQVMAQPLPPAPPPAQMPRLDPPPGYPMPSFSFGGPAFDPGPAHVSPPAALPLDATEPRLEVEFGPADKVMAVSS